MQNVGKKILVKKWLINKLIKHLPTKWSSKIAMWYITRQNAKPIQK